MAGVILPPNAPEPSITARPLLPRLHNTNIALTTIFSPPDSCFNNAYTWGNEKWYLKDAGLESSECYPRDYATLYTAQQPFRPGVCPAGYAIARSTVQNDDTTALCCPPSWFPDEVALSCSTLLAKPSMIQLPPGPAEAPEGAYLVMRGIYVAWASSDLASFTPASAPLSTAVARTGALGPLSTSAASTTSRASSSVQSTSVRAMTTPALTTGSEGSITSTLAQQAPASAESHSHHAGLSPGSKAGIAISVIFLAILSAAAMFFFIRCKGRRRQKREYLTMDEKMNESGAKLPIKLSTSVHEEACTGTASGTEFETPRSPVELAAFRLSAGPPARANIPSGPVELEDTQLAARKPGVTSHLKLWTQRFELSSNT